MYFIIVPVNHGVRQGQNEGTINRKRGEREIALLHLICCPIQMQFFKCILFFTIAN